MAGPPFRKYEFLHTYNSCFTYGTLFEKGWNILSSFKALVLEEAEGAYDSDTNREGLAKHPAMRVSWGYMHLYSRAHASRVIGRAYSQLTALVGSPTAGLRSPVLIRGLFSQNLFQLAQYGTCAYKDPSNDFTSREGGITTTGPNLQSSAKRQRVDQTHFFRVHDPYLIPPSYRSWTADAAT